MNDLLPIRLGIVGSSGGSALAAASNCLRSAGYKIEWIVVTDRKCGLSDWAEINGHDIHRIDYKNAEIFSDLAYAVFESRECDRIILFYTRRVASPLIDSMKVWNIHPSLLPSFRGLHGVADAVAADVKIFGATLHRVDSDLDTGDIASQVAAPLPVCTSISEIKRLSFFQKVWLTLVWFDRFILLNSGSDIQYRSKAVSLAYPGLSNKALLDSYIQWFEEQQLETGK